MAPYKIKMLIFFTAIFFLSFISFKFYTKLIYKRNIQRRIDHLKNSRSMGFVKGKNQSSFLLNFYDQVQAFEKKIKSSVFGYTREKGSEYRLRFEQAGLPAEYAPPLTIIVNFAMVIFGLVVYVLVLTFTKLGYSSLSSRLLVLCLILFLSFRFYSYVLDYIIHRRLKKIQRSLTFSIDLLMICTRSSLSIEKSFEKISEEIIVYNKELGKEFKRVSLELAILPDRSMALRNFARRNDIPMVQLMVSSLIQSMDQGASLSETLSSVSQEFLKHKFLSIEAKAAKLPVLLTLPLALFFIPSILIILLGPAVVNISRSSFGG